MSDRQPWLHMHDLGTWMFCWPVYFTHQSLKHEVSTQICQAIALESFPSKRVTVHNLSSDWRAWLPWRNVFSRRTQNRRRECGIRKHASVEHDSVINARARAVARFFESPFCPAFVFALFFYFCTRGQSELCDETITLSASKMSKSSGNHGGWQRKWVPTFLLQKSQTRKAAPKYYRCHSRSAPLKGFTFISSLNLGSIVNQTISSVFWN